MAVLVELCTFSPGIQQLTCTYYLPPGIQIEEETVPLLAALPVQFNRRSPQSGLGRDMHDVHSSANLPSSPLGSPKEPRILSTLREGYEEKKDGEDELKQAGKWAGEHPVKLLCKAKADQETRQALTAEEELEELQGQWELQSVKAKGDKENKKRKRDRGDEGGREKCEKTQVFVRGKKVEENDGTKRRFFRLVLAKKAIGPVDGAGGYRQVKSKGKGGRATETCNIQYLSDGHREALERHENDPLGFWRTKKGFQVQLSRGFARLADKDATELRGMADRLTKGHESLTEMLKDLEIERDLLQKEKGQLNETISLFMKELQKLHIGSQNTVEPMLEEGPLDFVGRFWETVKPRDTAYVAGEHIGEIRKPGEKPEGPNPLAALKQAALAHGVPHELPNVNVQEKVQEVQDMGKQAVKKLSTAFEEARSSAFWQRAQGYWEEKRSEIAKKVDEVRVSAAASTAQRVPAGKTRKKEPTVVAVEKSDAAPSESTTSATTQASEASQETTEPAESTGRGAEKPKPVEKTEVPEAKVEKAPEKEEKTETKEKSPTSRQETILIEAQVKIGDGSVQTLCVRASDRCKDAAERFISENSLK
ncbi:Integrase catalytic domain-containing protein, partial [Durusdinium trenchii]